MKIRHEKIGNLNLKIIGTGHRKYFLKKNKDYLKSEINKTEHIFFEEGLRYNNKFYTELANLIEDPNKPIYVPDSAIGVLGLSDFGLLGIGAKTLSSSFKKPISRRDFIKNGTRALMGTYLLANSFSAPFSTIIDNEITFDDKISYNTIYDFRNIVSVDNLQRAERDLEIKGNATYFIGAGHVDGLSAYINNPEMRKKRILYYPQDLFSDSKIKEYKKINGKWEITRKL